MRWPVVIRMVLLLLPPGWAAASWSDASAQPSETQPRAGLTVWDTGQPSGEPLTPAALAGKNNWTVIPPGKMADSFKGDAVLSNGRIVAVLRKQDATVAIHGVKPDGAVARLRLRLQTDAGEPAARLERVALVENGRGGACLEASFKTAKGTAVAGKFRIKRGDVSVQVEPGAGAGKLRVECPGRFVVLPDFFADDITLDASRLPLKGVELPSENFVLHLTGKGDAIAMCVFENRQQDVKVTLAGEGDQRLVTGSEIGFEGKKVWVALLEASRIWHVRDLKPADAGQVIPLDWKMPFPAQWRVDFTRPNDLTDSWEMLLQDQKGGRYTKPSWLGGGEEQLAPNRSRWNTVLGRYPYPCWSDPDRQGYLQPLKNKVLQFQGPALVYPINRVQQTPLDAFTVVDVMRNTLGVGPCQHILDLEGQKSQYKGRATCSVRDELTPIYASNQQKQKRAQVDKILDEGLAFVTHIRGRIARYVDFGKKMRLYLAEQKKAHPELGEFIAEMEKLTQEIDNRVAARVDKIKTPEHVARMNEDFRKNVLDYDGPDAAQRCKAYTEALVEIGDNQDELSGECRWVVKALRQRAGILMALDPRVAPVALEIRARTQEALRNPANHEGARH
jgi:hypothetical protein